MKKSAEIRGDVKRREALIIVLLVAVIAVLAALNAGRYFLRLDLSRNGMYSISSMSKKIARELTEPLSLTYYKSRKLAERYPFPQQIEDILGEYAVYSGGKISLAVIDPASSKDARQPEAFGVTGRQMQVTEKQELNVATVYSGVVIQYMGRYESLPFITDPGTLEYEVSSKIRALVSKRDTAVGVLLGDSQKSLENDYRALMQELEGQFKVETIQRGADIPPTVSTLLVIGNRDLEEYDLFPVDQFIMGGGKALFAMDPLDISVSLSDWQAVKTEKTAVFDMLAGYGVRVKDSLALDVVCQRLPFRTQNGQIMITPYPFWITVQEQSVSRTSTLTSRWGSLDMYWPSPLEIVERQGVKAEVLFSTSSEGWLMADNFQVNPLLARTPYVLDSGPKGSYPLAVSLTGAFGSFFKGRQIPTRAGETQKRSAIKADGVETRIIVIGDADFASDMIQYTQAENNPAFLSSCVEWLGMQEDLLGIKTKTQVDIRLNGIADPSVRAKAVLWVQVLNIAVIPLCVIAVGIIRYVLRRRRKNGRKEAEETR